MCGWVMRLCGYIIGRNLDRIRTLNKFSRLRLDSPALPKPSGASSKNPKYLQQIASDNISNGEKAKYGSGVFG